MKLFEQSFRSGWDFYVRVYDTQTQQSQIQKLPDRWEYYTRSPYGSNHSIYNPREAYTRHTGKGSIARTNVNPISPLDLIIREQFNGSDHYNHNPRIWYLDIETRVGTVSPGFPKPEKALEPVSLIQILDTKTKEVFIIGDKEFYGSSFYMSRDDVKDYKVNFIHVSEAPGSTTEMEMFAQLFYLLHSHKPAVVYAWNGEGFDFPYLFNRAKRLGLDVNKFSPWYKELFPSKHTDLRATEYSGFYVGKLTTAGCYYIDIKELYRKIVLAPRKSYALNSIAQVELKARKISRNEFKTFDDFYLGNYIKPENPTPEEKETLCYLLSEKGAPYDIIQKAGYGQFVYYGIIDVVLLSQIDAKVGLSKLMVDMTGKMNSNFDAVLGTVRIWWNAARNRYYQEGLILNKWDAWWDLNKQITGGYVRTPEKGRKQAVLSADVNSMYPILAIKGSNMSPETFRFIGKLKELYGDVGAELADFVRVELKVGTSDEQNEENLLRLIKDPHKKAKLSTLLEACNLSMAPNGTFYDKSKIGIIPQMVSEIYEGRKRNKKAMIKAEQSAEAVKEVLRSLNYEDIK